MKLTRVLQNTAAPISVVFYVGDTPTDATGVTVTITRADGTVLVNAGSTTHGATGEYKYTITQAHTGLLDDLRATWTGVIDGTTNTLTTFIEVVGGFVFSLPDARRSGLDAIAYSAQDIYDARSYAEDELENGLRFALVPRYAYESVPVKFGYVQLRPYVRTIRSATINGQALTTDDLTTLNERFVPGGDGLVPWTWGVGPWGCHSWGWDWPQWPQRLPHVLIGYEYGLDAPLAGAARAALELAGDFLGTSSADSIDPRATSIVTVDGTIQLSGSGGFGLRTVDSFVQRHMHTRAAL